MPTRRHVHEAAQGDILGHCPGGAQARTQAYGLDPAARSRLNAVLMTGVFVGMAAGGALGSVMLGRWGWAGVTTLASATAVGALVLRT